MFTSAVTGFGNALSPKDQNICMTTKLTEDFNHKWHLFCNAAKHLGLGPPVDPVILDAAKRVFPHSDFVAKNAIRHPKLLVDLFDHGHLQTQYTPDNYASMLEAYCAKVKDDTELSILLRRFRRREMIRIAWRDLAGWAGLSETMADLSALADACLDKALFYLYEWLCSEYGTPMGMDDSPQQLVVIGMGKLGGGELNFSSDIDLIFAYPDVGQTHNGKKEPMSNEAFFVRLCRRIIKTIGSPTADGIVFRVDMDLRPYGESGPLVMSFDAMEAYYQEQGREWERYAWIKARIVAGDRQAGRHLIERLRPFIYRKYLDFGAFEALRHMKQKIALEVKRKGMKNNIKLGPGGIREIEFFGQIFQLIRGGVKPSLQKRSIQKVLQILADENYISQQVCDELNSAYEFFRNIEHRLQVFSDQQTHAIPTDPHGMERVAMAMGFTDPESFSNCLDKHRNIVHDHFNKLLEINEPNQSNAEGQGIESGLEAVWLNLMEYEDSRITLEAAGYDHPDDVLRLLDYLRNDPATRSLSSSGRSRLDKLMPLMLKAIRKSEQSFLVLNRLVELIKSVERRTNYLALLIENPQSITHLVKLANASPWIISFLAKHPVLLDELLDPRTLYLPPDRSELVVEIRKRLDMTSPRDLEDQIQTLCVYKQTNILRVAAADVTGMLQLMRTSDHLTEIAEIILNEVVELSWHYLATKHGLPTCQIDNKTIDRGFAVIAYGKLGGIELGYASDLDLVFLHAGIRGQTNGKENPIDNAHFFSRLGQRVIHMLTAHTAAGILYEPDMRLRPSGKAGPLVSHIEGFKDYQMNNAWTWEHQALVRARPVIGEPRMMKQFNQIRAAVLSLPRKKSKLRKEIVDMRKRLRKEQSKSEPGFFDLKQDTGGIVDIEFLVQYLVLQRSYEHNKLLQWTDNVRILETLSETGVLKDHTAQLIKDAFLTYRAAVHQLNLQEKPAIVPASRFRSLRETVEGIWNDVIGPA